MMTTESKLSDAERDEKVNWREIEAEFYQVWNGIAALKLIGEGAVEGKGHSEAELEAALHFVLAPTMAAAKRLGEKIGYF